jgi:hypothetical protein
LYLKRFKRYKHNIHLNIFKCNAVIEDTLWSMYHLTMTSFWLQLLHLISSIFFTIVKILEHPKW